MKKILLSVATIAFAGAVVVGLSGAFYKDVETSTGNTFTAGGLELWVDNESHYDGMVCALNPDYPADSVDEYVWINDDAAHGGPSTYPELLGEPCGGTWLEQDLIPGTHMFFDFTDLKPGDFGEDTLSLHVYDNDAWARIRVENVIDSDNGCTEPEREREVELGLVCTDDGDGELDDNMTRIVWLDQGKMPGFQCGDDVDPCIDEYEGDNLWLEDYEPLISIDGIPIEDVDGNIIGMQYELWTTLEDAYDDYDCVATSGTNPDGHNDYGVCHGLAEDGRFVKSTTYYIGIDWEFDLLADNEVQTDTLVADVSFDVVQHRNNPNKQF